MNAINAWMFRGTGILSFYMLCLTVVVWEILSHAMNNVMSRGLKIDAVGRWFPTVYFALISLPSVHVT